MTGFFQPVTATAMFSRPPRDAYVTIQLNSVYKTKVAAIATNVNILTRASTTTIPVILESCAEL